MKYRYGWKRDKVGYHDRMFSFVQPAATLKPVFDLLAYCPPIMDQGQEGSCTAHGAMGVWNYRQLENMRLKKPAPYIFDPTQFKPGSRQFTYYNERLNEGTQNEDSGASLRDIIYAMTQVGVCAEELWDYSLDNLYTKPTDQAYTQAVNHKVGLSMRIPQAHINLKSALASGNPFVFGFEVFPSFEDYTVKTGFMQMPSYAELTNGPIGGHEVYCIGYNDHLQAYLCVNSWGTTFGKKGTFWMPYQFMENPGYASDMWTFY